MKKDKRISFHKHDAHHLYELALEHFCTEASGGNCYSCNQIKTRLEKFLGKKDVKHITKIIKKNGYCNKLKFDKKWYQFWK